jgi:defect in organelle trafficking protein DotC
MKRFILPALCLLCAIALSGCATQRMKSVNTTNLYDLETLTASNAPLPAGSGISRIRLNALKETAIAVGAQGGLVWQSEKINESLIRRTNILNRIFDFRRLMLNHNVLPPVLEKGRQLLTMQGTDAIRIADQTYKIIKQAHFTTAPPTWRQYLWTTFKKPKLPDQTLLPRNQKERIVWITQIRQGWKRGIEQAKNIYSADLARLKRDYNGMALYRTLLAKNMVSKPFVTKTRLGVTSNSEDTQLYINDQIMRIVALPHLNPNSSAWKALVTPHD